VFTGRNAGYSNTSGSNNVFTGRQAGEYNTTGSNNIFSGYFSGYTNTTGSANIFVGSLAGLNNMDTDGNTYVGVSAGYNMRGSINIALGQEALYGSGTPANNTGANNIALGYKTGYSNTTGSHNIFSGNSAGYFNTEGTENIFSGYYAGNFNTTGSANVFSGSQAGYFNSTGSFNIFFGANAGYSNTTGSNNVIIGFGANVATNSTSDAIALGHDAIATSDSIALGIGATNDDNNQLMIGSAGTPIDEIVMVSTGGTTCAIDINGTACSSDEQLKDNIMDLNTNILDALTQVRTVTFNWNGGSDTRTRIGFIAQDIQQYFPELVSKGSTGYLSVNYAGITPVLVEAIRELDLKLTGIQNLSDETFLSRMRNWFADTENGIGSFIAGTIRAKDQLCVGNTCVTESQLQQLLNNQNMNSENSNYSPNDNDGQEFILEENNDSEIIDENTENISDESIVNNTEQEDTTGGSTQEIPQESAPEESSGVENNDSGEGSPTE
jgi:hypothetical protein